jgi:hypothetical protein
MTQTTKCRLFDIYYLEKIKNEKPKPLHSCKMAQKRRQAMQHGSGSYFKLCSVLNQLWSDGMGLLLKQLPCDKK